MSKPIEIPPFDQYNKEMVSNAHPPDWQNPLPADRYNLLVIGGGSAGLVAAIGAAGVGAKVALVEKFLLGGDCLYAGCVPSKTLIRSARAVADIRRASQVGVHVEGEVRVDFAAVMERVRRVRAEISHHDSAQRVTNEGVDLFLGEGQFTGPDRFDVDGRTIRFKKAIIATGARPAHLSLPGLDDAGYLTNVSLFELTELPRRLAVIGAGPIGAEMAQAFRRLGSELFLFDIVPYLAGLRDGEDLEIVTSVFREEGINLFLDSKTRSVEKRGADKLITFEHQGGTKTVAVDEILLAVGRQPNVEGLNLEAAGVQYNEQGIVADDFLQTDNDNIYAVGDVTLPHQFTHTADASARMAVQNALFLGRQRYSQRIIPWVVYTDPEIAHVGLFDYEAEEQGIATDTYQIPIRQTDRGRTDALPGCVKIFVKEGTDDIIGATIIARHAGEMIGEVTTAMVTGAGLKTLTKVIHPYPTQAEAIRKAADAWNRTRLTPLVARLFDGWLALTR